MKKGNSQGRSKEELEKLLEEQSATIKMLEQRIESQEIIIESLVSNMKLLKPPQSVAPAPAKLTEVKEKAPAKLPELKEKAPAKLPEPAPKPPQPQPQSQSQPPAPKQPKKTPKKEPAPKPPDAPKRLKANEPPDSAADSDPLLREVDALFAAKEKKREFKMNFTFRAFVEYAEAVYEFNLMNKKVSTHKNPLKGYIATYRDHIVKHVIENINTLNLNQICSSLFMINCAFDDRRKMVIAHDIILELQAMPRVLFILSALFRNTEPDGGLIWLILKKILYHQSLINSELYHSEGFAEQMDLISRNLGLEETPVTLWDCFEHFLTDIPLFAGAGGRLEISRAALEAGFALRMLAHYLDWDCTYNEFIVKSLCPLVREKRRDIHVYYLGVLGMNALRVFGPDAVVSSLFEELEGILAESGAAGLGAYIVLRQVGRASAEQWLRRHAEELAARPLCVDELRRLVVL